MVKQAASYFSSFFIHVHITINYSFLGRNDAIIGSVEDHSNDDLKRGKYYDGFGYARFILGKSAVEGHDW